MAIQGGSGGDKHGQGLVAGVGVWQPSERAEVRREGHVRRGD